MYLKSTPIIRNLACLVKERTYIGCLLLRWHVSFSPQSAESTAKTEDEPAVSKKAKANEKVP